MSDTWPVPVSHIVLFISYCFEVGYSPATIRLYTAGICYQHKLRNWPDPSDYFIVKKLLEGCKRLRCSQDSRVPITQAILHKICQLLSRVAYSVYEAQMFRAVYSLAYFGLFRVSELVFTTVTPNRALQLDDMHFDDSFQALIIRIRSSKTNQAGPPVMVRIPRSDHSSICCVRLMQAFMRARQAIGGFLFCHANGAPLTRSQFSGVLSKVLNHAGMPSSKYRSHSFRIGRASELAIQGVPDDVIKQLGRWSSGAYKKYLRL